ncbi:MAG: hypothetical protein RMK01_06950 [Thermomicrobium sp.]|nr:hypothetical protein [Thermomicrobium sp.]MDW8059798.1 hypothetical protein [Thermomicrobium sp.]
MERRTFQPVGRRNGRPEVLLFRDQEGRYYLRHGCGGRLVRLTARDAEQLLRHSGYRPILSSAWFTYEEVIRVDCPLPFETAGRSHEL